MPPRALGSPKANFCKTNVSINTKEKSRSNSCHRRKTSVVKTDCYNTRVDEHACPIDTLPCAKATQIRSIEIALGIFPLLYIQLKPELKFRPPALSSCGDGSTLPPQPLTAVLYFGRASSHDARLIHVDLCGLYFGRGLFRFPRIVNKVFQRLVSKV